MSVVLWLGKKGIYLVFRVGGIVSFGDGEAGSFKKNVGTVIKMR